MKYATHFEIRNLHSGTRKFRVESALIVADSPKEAMLLGRHHFTSAGFEVRDPIMCEYNDDAGNRVRITNDWLADILK